MGQVEKVIGWSIDSDFRLPHYRFLIAFFRNDQSATGNQKLAITWRMSPMLRKLLLLTLSVLSVTLLGFAQDSSTARTQQKPAPPQDTINNDADDIVRITTNLVQIDVVVTKNGKVVKGLTADDFQIFEDGRRQTITNFSYISNISETATTSSPAAVNKDNKTVLPPPAPVKPNEARRMMALVVDDLGLSAESINQVRRQLRTFVDEQMQPNDLVAIIRTGADIGALQQFTNDKRLLHAAIKQAQWNICSRVGPNVFINVQQGTVPLAARTGGSTCGWESVRSTLTSLRFILQAMGELPGRKSMVIFSDSIPRQEQEVIFREDEDVIANDDINYYGLLQRLAEIAIRNSIVIYGVDTQGLQTLAVGAADMVTNNNLKGSIGPEQINSQTAAIRRSRMLQMIARREGADVLSNDTGGFLIKNSNDFKMNRIMADQQGYYLIGYRPSDNTFNRHFHHVSAKVKGSGLTLRTRKGFYGFTEEEAERMKRSVTDKTNLALMSPFRANDIAVDLATVFADDPTSGPLIRSYLFMNAKDLTFTDDGEGWHKLAVEVRGIIFGNNGRIVEAVSVTPTVRLRRQAYELYGME
jgi:VWFA-related protein